VENHASLCIDLGRYHLEPQNVEQGISNIEVKTNKLLRLVILLFDPPVSVAPARLAMAGGYSIFNISLLP
jgi:hypothetical protein